MLTISRLTVGTALSTMRRTRESERNRGNDEMRSTSPPLVVGENGLDARAITGPEDFVGMVTRHRQAKANAFRSRESARARLGLPRAGEHELTDVEQRIVEIRVAAILDLVELDIGDFGVARRAAH